MASHAELEINNTINVDINNQYTSTIDKIIKKYNITDNTEHNNIKVYIIKYILDNIFESFIEDNIITKDNNLYIYGNYISKKSNIIKYIFSNYPYKTKLKALLCCMYNNIIKKFKLEKNKIIISANNIKIMKIQKKIEKLDKKKMNFSELLDKRNSEDLETTYKQTRIEMEMNNQIHQINFERVNIGIAFTFNQQQYDTQIHSKDSLILKRNDQIQTLNNNLLINRHYIENLQMDISKKIIQHHDEKIMIATFEKTNKLQLALINESIELRNTMNESFVKMINAMREDTEALIKVIDETSSLTRQSIVDATTHMESAIIDTSHQMRKSIQEQSIIIQQTIRKNAEESRQELIKIHNVIQEGNRLKLLILDKIKEIYTNIGRLESDVRHAITTAENALSIVQNRYYGYRRYGYPYY
jgi:hypothetical protein